MVAATRTTLPIRPDLLEAVDGLIREGRFGSRGALVELALQRLLWDLEEAEMYAAFESAADDPEEVRESLMLAEEGAGAGWEALQMTEPDEPAH